MKRIILALTFLLATSSATSAQFAPGNENLRGLKGVHLIVMFDGPTRAEALDEVKRPGVLRTLEADTKAKLEKAGIPFSRSKYNDEISKDYARLIVLVRLNVLDGSGPALEPEVKLLQRIRLARDPSIEFDAVSWSLKGVGNKDEMPMLQSLIGDLIDGFIRDYVSVNPKQSASSNKDKSRDAKQCLWRLFVNS